MLAETIKYLPVIKFNVSFSLKIIYTQQLNKGWKKKDKQPVLSLVISIGCLFSDKKMVNTALAFSPSLPNIII